MKPWETSPERYGELLEEKCAGIAGDFVALGAPEAEIFPSPAHSYRVRAEFRVWHDGDDLAYVMFDSADPRVPAPVDDFVPALEPIRKLMPALRSRLATSPPLRRKLFQVEFLASRDGSVLVTLI